MDPNETLEELRHLMCAIQNDEYIDTTTLFRIAEMFNNLDSWLCEGGFLPSAWRQPNAI